MTIISLLETEYSEESRLTSYGHKYAIQSLEIMHNNLAIERTRAMGNNPQFLYVSSVDHTTNACYQITHFRDII